MTLLKLKKPHQVTLFLFSSLENVKSVNCPRREWIPSDESLFQTRHSNQSQSRPKTESLLLGVLSCTGCHCCCCLLSDCCVCWDADNNNKHNKFKSTTLGQYMPIMVASSIAKYFPKEWHVCWKKKGSHLWQSRLHPLNSIYFLI